MRADADGFDTIARLLTATLMGMVCISRCLFSAACGGTLAAVRPYKSSESAPLLLLVATGGFWLAQAASVAIVLVYLFAIPVGASWMRSRTGNAAPFSVVLFASVTMIAGLRLTSNAVVVATHSSAKASSS